MNLSEKLLRFSEIVTRERYTYYGDDREQTMPNYTALEVLSPGLRAYRVKPYICDEFKSDCFKLESWLGVPVPEDFREFYKRWGIVCFDYWGVDYELVGEDWILDCPNAGGGVSKYGSGRAAFPFMEIEGECFYCLRTFDGGRNWEVVWVELFYISPFSAEDAVVTDKGFFELLDRLDRTNGWPPIPSNPDASFNRWEHCVDRLEDIPTLPDFQKAKKMIESERNGSL